MQTNVKSNPKEKRLTISRHGEKCIVRVQYFFGQQVKPFSHQALTLSKRTKTKF